MKNSTIVQTFLLLVAVGVFGMSAIPGTADAASSRPSCELSVDVDGVYQSVHGTSPVIVRSGSPIVIHWESNRATKVVDPTGRVVSQSGFATVTPVRNTTCTDTFTRGSSRTTCALRTAVVSGSIDEQSRGQVSARPTIAGRARGVSSARLSLVPFGTTTPIYGSGILRLHNGHFTTQVTNALPDGMYQVIVEGYGSRNHVLIATSTLQVGTTSAVSALAPTVVIVPVPLLLGGVAHPGVPVAVAYLQVINLGTATATLAGFTLTQTGTAPVSTVVGLTAITDNGVARGSVGTMVSGTPFTGLSVFVPLVATLAPKEMRLVTIKAVMNPVLAPYLGNTLTLRVTGVTGNLKPHAAFPLFGTVWTMGQ